MYNTIYTLSTIQSILYLHNIYMISTAQAALSQFLALEIARMSAERSESKITKYMPWLFNPPNTITTQVAGSGH